MHKFDPLYDLPIRDVLLATDFSDASDAAFRAALQLCSDFKARLHILNVCEYETTAGPLEQGRPFTDFGSIRESAELSLDSLIQEARLVEVACDGMIADGLPHVAILAAAATQKVDLIVLGTRSIRGFERLVFGSTAEAVLRQAHCPVFTVGPQALREHASKGVVVFATDFHSTTLNALYSAVSFSKRLHLPLHCLNVLPRGLESVTDKGILPSVVIEALRHLVNEVDGEVIPPVCAVTYGSEISNAVVAYANEHDAKLIVLGVRRSSLAASLVPAHIAYRIIAEAPCPVLTRAFAPEGFDGTANRLHSGLPSDEPRMSLEA